MVMISAPSIARRIRRDGSCRAANQSSSSRIPSKGWAWKWRNLTTNGTPTRPNPKWRIKCCVNWRDAMANRKRVSAVSASLRRKKPFMAENKQGDKPVEMRDAFGSALVELGGQYPNMVVLDADL